MMQIIADGRVLLPGMLVRNTRTDRVGRILADFDDRTRPRIPSEGYVAVSMRGHGRAMRRPWALAHVAVVHDDEADQVIVVQGSVRKPRGGDG